MNSSAEQHSASLQAQLLELQAENNRLGLDSSSLQLQLQEQRRQADDYLRQLTAVQGAISEQQDDMRSALQLVSASRRGTQQAAYRPLPAATLSVASSALRIPSSASGVVQQQQYVPAGWMVHNVPPAGGSLMTYPELQSPGAASSLQPARAELSRSGPPAEARAAPVAHRHSASAGRDAASTALIAARVAAAAAAAAPGRFASQKPAESGSTRSQPWGSALHSVGEAASFRQHLSSAGSELPPALSIASPSTRQRGWPSQSSTGMDAARQPDQLKDDMQDLDKEIVQLEAMLQRASRQLA